MTILGRLAAVVLLLTSVSTSPLRITDSRRDRPVRLSPATTTALALRQGLKGTSLCATT